MTDNDTTRHARKGHAFENSNQSLCRLTIIYIVPRNEQERAVNHRILPYPTLHTSNPAQTRDPRTQSRVETL
jgi:hypothetical protein